MILLANNSRLSQGAWEGFVAEDLQRSWEMALRGLDPKMIANLYDVVERNFSKMSAQFEASLVDQDKKEVVQFQTKQSPS